MAELLPGDQHHGVAIDGLELRNRAPDPHRVVEVAAVGAACQAGEHAKPFGEAEERALAAAVVAAGVEDDAAQPGRELRFAAEATDLLDQGATHVLRDVVGVGARAGQLPGEAVDAIIMPAQQRGEGVAVAANGRGDQRGIRISLHAPLLPDPAPGCHRRQD